MRRILATAAIASVLIGLLGPVGIGIGAAPRAAKDERVEAKDNVFAPGAITVDEGDTVTFVNTGQLPHTATAKDKSWDTGNLDPGQSKSITIGNPGTIEYACLYHEGLGMVGKITVVGGGPARPVSPAPAAPASPSPQAQASPEASPTGVLAEPPDPNATVPIGLRVFPFLAVALVVLFVGAAAAGYIRNIITTTEGR